MQSCRNNFGNSWAAFPRLTAETQPLHPTSPPLPPTLSPTSLQSRRYSRACSRCNWMGWKANGVRSVKMSYVPKRLLSTLIPPKVPLPEPENVLIMLTTHSRSPLQVYVHQMLSFPSRICLRNSLYTSPRSFSFPELRQPPMASFPSRLPSSKYYTTFGFIQETCQIIYRSPQAFGIA
jgi:hypothetical protein